MADGDTGTTRRRGIWRIVLIASLGLNLLIAGLVLGAVLHGPPDRDGRPELHDLGFGPFVSALPQADREALGEALKREEGSFRERRTALRREFQAFLAALRAEPYDHGAVERIVTSQQEEVFESQRLGRALLLERIAEMNGAQRADYAEALERGVRRWHRPPHRDRD
ncbi:periplasmic heavy metal sensor [Psychromarinibacter sp. C21-152]|uniref:Periplasmic heavy metal sensor n=1 Tax=Psychromarinibacter sediminicola TaxID=3033385 RepID=A0AAE3TA45_9RHOB|nr:periplasmic heavy metal sensor [Psychromarinibacter sediminicola]MDF0602887.1 periplasmic heavy metal sensor [Psychromarinibacter sediminicola]